ncbi:MAG: HDOD domain-containing protein [Candidatus Competibacteraceae bacterium]|nr:HDOD domain-containing protein [Candidatus Competibacteraceae bacterium]
MLGIDHAETGAELLAAWGLPDNVADVVRYHHRPDDMPGDRVSVDLVHIADLVSIEAGLGVGIDGLAYRPAPGALLRLGIKRKILEAVCIRILTKMDDLLTHVGS